MTVRTGLVEIEEAIKLYQKMPQSIQAGSLHPLYVQADAQRDEELRPVFWVYEKQENLLIHGFHLASIPNTEWQDIQSPYGYGGPLANTDEVIFLSEADEAFKQWAFANAVVAEFIRFHPLIENWKYYLGPHEFDRDTCWVDCSQQDILMTYEVRQRTAVRKAIKCGVEVEWLSKSALLELFPPFYLQAMKSINASEFYFFSKSYFEAILNLPFVSGVAAKLKNEVIAMSLFLGDGIGEYHLSGKTHGGAQASASNLLIHEAVLKMQEMDIEKLYLGGGSSSASDDSLLFFKTGFSKNRSSFRIGKRVLMPQVYEKVKKIYPERYAQFPKRILFYRS